VVPSVEAYSEEGEQLAKDVRDVRAPFRVLVTGPSAELVDSKESLFDGRVRDPRNARPGVHAVRRRGELVGTALDAAHSRPDRDQPGARATPRGAPGRSGRRTGGVVVTTRSSAVRARPRSRRGEGETLRNDLLDATERLMIETGSVDAVSIRAIADAVGVTPPSIYLHFPDKESLILAVCERHFDVFDSGIEQAGRSTNDPVESLRRRGRAYVRFGVENPEPYRVLFMTRTDRDQRVGAGARAFQHLVGAVQRCIDAGEFRAVDPVLAATGVWTAVHGVTSVLISMPAFPWPDVDTLVGHVCDTQIRGLTEPAHEDQGDTE
jgi:AcrR family transcriptional regulator